MKSTPSSALPLLLFAAGLPAQGQVNPSLLSARPETPEASARRQTDTAAIVATGLAAVVHVYVEVTSGRNPFKIERPSSGVVVGAEGLVVTHWSLVRESRDGDDKRVVVQLGDAAKTTLVAKIVARDESSGLALLRVELPDGRKLAALELAASSRLAPGEPAVVLSYHDGVDHVAFAGVASRAVGGTTVDGHELAAADIVLTDAAIQRRHHGAALIDAGGCLLGLCNAEHVRRDIREPTLADLKGPSFGFAIPADRIRKAFGKHLESAEPSRRPSASGTAAAVARVAKPVVGVWAGVGERPVVGLMDPYATQRREHLGSGVIVGSTGLALTNWHLVQNAKDVTVTLHDGRAVAAEVLKAHPAANLALLKLKLPAGAKVVPVDCGRTRDAMTGETVLGVGRPFGGALTVTAGVLSAKRSQGRLQADPNLGNNNGGGALVDVTGRLIGIVDGGLIDKIDLAYMRRGDEAKTETNLSYCVGIAAIRRIFDSEIDEVAGDDPIANPRAAGDADVELRSNAVTEVVESTAGALLNVYVSRSSRQDDEEDNPFAAHKEPEIVGHSLGSGVIIDRSGLALTNWHVVDSATEPSGAMRRDHVVHARLRNGKTYEVEVLSISREDDLALLQLKVPSGEPITAIELGDSDALHLGETVLAIGNPHGRANTVTAGIVSAKGQGIRVKGRWAKLTNLLETDAAINGGNSGGALLDINGKLVGINSAGSRGFSGKGYAIPVNHVREKTLSLLLSPEKLRSPNVGMRVMDADGRITVISVHAHGPARRAGIEAGDHLVKMNGTPLTWSVGYARLLLAQTHKRPIELQLERKGKAITLEVQPLSAAAWAVFRQTGLEVREIPTQEAPDAIRRACIAMHRRFTGDPRSVPSAIQQSLVRVERVHPRLTTDAVDIRPGDLFLGVALAIDSNVGDTTTLRRFTAVPEIQALFNDSAHNSYDGVEFDCWIYRDGEIEVVPLTAKRLML